MIRAAILVSRRFFAVSRNVWKLKSVAGNLNTVGQGGYESGITALD